MLVFFSSLLFFFLSISNGPRLSFISFFYIFSILFSKISFSSIFLLPHPTVSSSPPTIISLQLARPLSENSYFSISIPMCSPHLSSSLTGVLPILAIFLHASSSFSSACLSFSSLQLNNSTKDFLFDLSLIRLSTLIDLLTLLFSSSSPPIAYHLFCLRPEVVLPDLLSCLFLSLPSCFFLAVPSIPVLFLTSYITCHSCLYF